MTAIEGFERLEASGLWRENGAAQRREVVLSLGDSTLKISDMSDRVLAHWSLAAVQKRVVKSADTVIYHPDEDADEYIEISTDEKAMIDAIAAIQKAIARRRARPGRLRLMIGAALAVTGVLAGVLWLPQGLRDYAAGIVPEAQRAEIGDALLQRIERTTGARCNASGSAAILRSLATRTGAERIVILPEANTPSFHLPGGIVVLHRELVEDYDDPAVPAGFVLTELARMNALDPLRALLNANGLGATVSLLGTGKLAPDTLAPYAETLLSPNTAPIRPEAILAEFARTELPATPFAYALDITGSNSAALIAGDPIQVGDAYPPVLNDADWVQLQGICAS